MKKIALAFIVFLSLFKSFSDCYFSVDGIMTNTNEKNNSGENIFGWYIAGSFGLATAIKADNFNETKTFYVADLFTEIQFVGRKILEQVNSNSEKYRDDNDIYCSAGLTFFELIRPKISYGFLSKDFFVSCVFGLPIHFERKFMNNETSVCGFQIHAGLEPIWNISERDSFTAPSYMNFRANFKIYLDFSRRNRYAKYVDNQRKIQAEKEEYESKLREQQAAQERIERERQRKEDEKTAKQLGFSSVEDYYADLRKKEQVKERQSFNNFYNQVLYEEGIPLEIGDMFSISSGRIKVVDRIVENDGYTYLVTFVSSAAQNSIDYARSFGAYGGGFKHSFYITTNKPLNLMERTELTTYERYVTNRNELKLMCAGKAQYQRNYQDVDCYIFVGSE